MMAEADLVLAVDSSDRADGRLVLTDPSGRVMASHSLVTGVTGLVAAAADLVKVAGAQLTRVVVACGPGSYIGVRSGMALALGVAQGRGLSIHQVGSLEVVAASVTPGPGDLLVVVSAGRGGFYGQRFRGEVGPLVSKWRPVSASCVLGRDGGWPQAWKGMEYVLQGAGVDFDLPPRTQAVTAARSPLEALAKLASSELGAANGYDQLRADYGVRIEEVS
ncbi:MAG: tRNA (adenosine(37)-N6)-threonylcarbamoyltransferase complex dimerization subunit type 1 TsaB [Candidatus Dormibacteria bacterium]